MVTQYYSFSSFVPRHSYKPAGLYHDTKNRAMLRSTTAVPGLCPEEAFQPTASVRSATQTPFIAGPLAVKFMPTVDSVTKI